jgi:hypothetical protein
LSANQSAVIPSPQLGRTQRTATVTAPLDEATAIALVAENGPRKPGDCIYAALGATNAFVSEPTTSHESEREEAEHRDAEDLRQLLLPQIFKATFVQCLGLLAQAPSAKGATAAASRCHTSALVIKVRHTGKLLRRVGRDRKPPLTISCSIAPAGLRVHLATNGGGCCARWSDRACWSGPPKPDGNRQRDRLGKLQHALERQLPRWGFQERAAAWSRSNRK